MESKTSMFDFVTIHSRVLMDNAWSSPLLCFIMWWNSKRSTLSYLAHGLHTANVQYSPYFPSCYHKTGFVRWRCLGSKPWAWFNDQLANPNSLPYESSAKSLVKPGPMVLIQRFLNGLAWDHFGFDLEVRGWVLSQVLEWTSTALLELVTCKDDVRDAYGISE